jgi:hypothetical protein
MSMLKQLPAEPIKGMRKLLKIYFENVRLKKSSVGDKN